ncbi:MAG: putative molybdenum carrier protein [Victivallaceae bacterium]
MKKQSLCLIKVISGGQTGVDRAALDAGIQANMPIGGWCTKGRRAEDGVIDSRYPLQETASRLYQERTRKNVIESDATLIIAGKLLSGGTALTRDFAEKQSKPLLIVNPADAGGIGKIRQWLAANSVRVLNVAGPRESANPGIYSSTHGFLTELFKSLK